MLDNPYDPPLTASGSRPSNDTGAGWVRSALYLHLAMVAICGVAVANDSGRLELADHWLPFVHLFMAIAPLTLWLNPTLVLTAIKFSQLSRRRTLLIYAVESGLIFTHLLALFPAIQ